MDKFINLDNVSIKMVSICMIVMFSSFGFFNIMLGVFATKTELNHSLQINNDALANLENRIIEMGNNFWIEVFCSHGANNRVTYVECMYQKSLEVGFPYIIDNVGNSENDRRWDQK